MDFLSVTFPNYSLLPYEYGNIASINILSANMGLGLGYRKKHWEISPLYPCLMYSFGMVGDGIDGWEAFYPSISLVSKIAYTF